MTRKKWTRREALKLGCAAFAAPYFVPAHVLGWNGQAGANDKVNVGIIGLGGRARSIVKESRDVRDMRIVAVCDCYRELCGKFISDVGEGQNWAAYDDFRRMFDQENLDGVFLETTTHARAWVTAHAMQAGLDTYIEKPMCLTIQEGRYLVEAARKYNRVTQVGTQQRSMPMNNWASDLVKKGGIGKVHTVLAPNFVGPDRWTSQESQPLPKGGREGWWDTWTNQAVFRPYHVQLQRGWDRWWDYDGGGRCFGVTGWGTHSYDQIQRALGTDETGPVEVMLEEPVSFQSCGKFEPTAEVDQTSLDYLLRLAQPVAGPRAKVRLWFASGAELRLQLDGDWGPGLGAIFVGDQGKMEINRDKIASNPKELVDSPENPGPNQKPETQYHIENWIECVKTRERCNADIEYGQRSTTLCYLVNIVREIGRVGERLKWDPKTERFTNCDEANQLLTRPRRAGWGVAAAGVAVFQDAATLQMQAIPPEKHAMSLAGQVAIITGASSGIGAGVAEDLSQAGMKLILTARRADRLEALAERLGCGIAAPGDLADPAMPQKLIDMAVDQYGRCDVVLNGAGVMHASPLEQADVETLCRMIRVNCEAATRMAYVAVKYFAAVGSGHLVNISSVLGTKVRPNAGVYAGTKFALEALSEALRMELAKTNVKVSVIEPGLVATELQDHFEVHPRELLGIEQPLQPADIARCVRFVLEQPPHVRIPVMMVLPGEQAM